MHHLLASPRLQALLDAADDAWQGRDADLPPDAELAQLYQQLGEALYHWVRTGVVPPHREEVGADDTTAFIEPEPAARRESWYTDEVERPPGPLFDPDDLGPPQHTDIPESDLLIEPDEPEPEPFPDDGWELFTLARLTALADDPSEPLAELRQPTNDPPSWRLKLNALCELLELPADPTDPAQISIESSQVQWACADLPARLDPLPASVQVGLIALLAARAQHLRLVLDHDAGPRLALDRLRRYRLERELPTVPALTAEPLPERGAWLDDISALWALLNPPGPR